MKLQLIVCLFAAIACVAPTHAHRGTLQQDGNYAEKQQGNSDYADVEQDNFADLEQDDFGDEQQGGDDYADLEQDDFGGVQQDGFGDEQQNDADLEQDDLGGIQQDDFGDEQQGGDDYADLEQDDFGGVQQDDFGDEQQNDADLEQDDIGGVQQDGDFANLEQNDYPGIQQDEFAGLEDDEDFPAVLQNADMGTDAKSQYSSRFTRGKRQADPGMYREKLKAQQDGDNVPVDTSQVMDPSVPSAQEGAEDSKAVVQWNNRWRSTFRMHCRAGYGLYAMRSIQNYHVGDRLFRFHCKRIAPKSSCRRGYNPNRRHCKWYKMNNFRQSRASQCPHNYFMAGIYSKYNTCYRDREFWSYCCHTPHICTRTCRWTGYLNHYNRNMFYKTRGVFSGMISYFNSRKRDRRFRVKYCYMKWC